MRLARAHKYVLLLRMVQRLHQAGQVWPAGESQPARLVWGAHTPTDRTTVLADVVAGYGAGVFSLETAVRMLQDAGYPIEDIPEEIERIQRRAFDQAARLADATGDNAAVREYLQLPEADPIPQVPLIPAAQQLSRSPATPSQSPASGETGSTGTGISKCCAALVRGGVQVNLRASATSADRDGADADTVRAAWICELCVQVVDTIRSAR